MDSASLIIRADAGTQIGTGHVMRCLALAQAWRDGGGKVIFAMTTSVPALETWLYAAGVSVTHLSVQSGSEDDAAETVALARRNQASWVVADGYHFGIAYQRCVKDAGLQLLVIDDYGHAERYSADIVLNQNLHAHERLYDAREPYTRLLLGTRYVLLRREFLQTRVQPREMPTVACRILVTVGGSDPEDVTGKILRALEDIAHDGVETIVVVGASNPHAEHLASVARTCRGSLRLEHNVANLATLMGWADLAISAAGTTAWELAFMGLPSLLVPVADNQRLIAAELDRAGAAINLGWHEHLTVDAIARRVNTLRVSSEKCRQMSARGTVVVDGNGADRVVAALKGDGLRLRAIHLDDCRVLWDWANDPSVREVSFTSDCIPWETHQKWFHAKLHDPHCVFYIATDSDDAPIGQARYDLEDDQGVVSISLDRRVRGKGYGSALLRLSAQKLFATIGLTTIHAYIKSDNLASVRAFEKAGYTNVGVATMRPGAVHLTLSRNES